MRKSLKAESRPGKSETYLACLARDHAIVEAYGVRLLAADLALFVLIIQVDAAHCISRNGSPII